MGGLSPGFESPALALASAVAASNHGVSASNFAPKMSSSGNTFAPGVQLAQANPPSRSGTVSDSGSDWDWAKIIWGMAATIYSDDGGIPPRGRTQTWNGKVISGKFEDHHRLPQAYKKQFEAAGLDIDKFKIKIPVERHRLLPDGVHTGPNNWNKQWGEFFEQTPDARAPQILRQLDKMDRQFFADIIR